MGVKAANSPRMPHGRVHRWPGLTATCGTVFVCRNPSRLAPALTVARLDVEAMKVVHPGRWGEAVVTTHATHTREPRMNIHKNARLTPQGRALLVQRVRTDGWQVGDAAAAAGISLRQAFRWPAWHRAGGELACGTVVRRPPDARTAPTLTLWLLSSGCVANSAPARRSRMSSVCRARPSAPCCAGSALDGSARSRPSPRSCARSARNLVNSSTSTSRNSAASTARILWCSARLTPITHCRRSDAI